MKHGLYLKKDDRHYYCTKCNSQVETLKYGVVWLCRKCKAVIVDIDRIKVVRRVKED